VNTAFLTMAISKGLTMAIANPSQELLMNAAFASDMLLHRPESDIRYIEHMSRMAEKHEAEQQAQMKQLQAAAAQGGISSQGSVSVPGSASGSGTASAPGRAAGAVSASGSVVGTDTAVTDNAVFQAVLKGNKGTIIDEVKKQLAAGDKPDTVINQYLISAINEVGELFNRKKYFLPQLIGSANTMKLAIEYLEPLLEKKSDGADMPTLVFATVEGDIHDIGKNLVVLMLKNYGYRVIDLGKDVPAETIVDTAMKEHAAIIGLSALMTTTMMRMQDVIELCREKGCISRVIIGGACITQSFADEIGADGYSKDAAECVKLVGRLLAE
jgi:5-methyltetrahydrofolate--homocysteine methyltransferase